MSIEAINIIIASLRTTTRRQYSSYIDRFLSFVHGNELSLITDVQLVEYLNSLYSQGLGYSALNTARSAVSTLLELCGYQPLGRSSGLVTRFMRGVFNNRPTLPRYINTWQPDRLMNYFINSKDVDSLASVTIKCVSLLALVSSLRVSALHSLKLGDIQFINDQAIIHVSSLQKQTRPGYHPSEIVVDTFSDNCIICPVRTLKKYIDMSSTHRNAEEQLFLSFCKPYKKVAKSTIARWLNTALRQAGIDTSFKPHSFRSASTSALSRNGMPIDDILKHAGWSRSSTFRNFYNLPVKISVTNAILS